MTTFLSPWQSPAILPRRSKSSKGEKRSSFFLGFLQPLMASKSNTSGWFPHPLESELLSSRPKTRKTCEAILVMISSWVGVPGIITFTLDVTHHKLSHHVSSNDNGSCQLGRARFQSDGARLSISCEMVAWLHLLYQSPSFLRPLFGDQKSWLRFLGKISKL